MANIFDQFDDEEQAPVGGGTQPNIFDQFDEVQDGQSGGAAKPLLHPGQATLPAPRPNMFAGMEDEHAQAVYEAFSRHADTTLDENGDLIYRGKPVPRPEGNPGFLEAAGEVVGAINNPGYLARKLVGEEKGVGENVSSGAVGGVWNAGRAALVGLSAGGAYLGDKITDIYQTPEQDAAEAKFMGDRHKALEDAIPEFNPEGNSQGVGELTGQIGAGLIFGNKLAASGKIAKPVANTLKVTVPKATSYITKVLKSASGSAAGTAATMDGAAGTWFFEGLDGKDENAATAEVEKRINMFVENFILGASTELGADGLKHSLKALYTRFAEPIVAAGSEAVKERIIFNAAMHKAVLAADPKATVEESAAIQNKIIDIVADPRNSKIFFPMSKVREGMSDVDLELDVASIISRGLADDPDEAALLIKRSFEQQRKDVLDKGGQHVQTAGAVDRPVVALLRLTTEGEEVFGGNEAVQSAQRGIQKAGQEEVGQALASEKNTSLALDSLEEGRRETFANDDLLGARLTKMETEPSSAALGERNTISNEIAGNVDLGNKLLKAVNDGHWEAIPDGLPLDRESLATSLDAARPYLGNMVVNSIEEAHDLKSLMNVRGDLQNRINGLEGQIGFEEVVKLRDEITKNQPNFVRSLVEGGGVKGTKEGYDKDTMKVLNEGVDSINAAEDYFKNVRAPARQGVPGDIVDIRGKHRKNLPKSDDLVGERLHEAVTSDQPAQLQHFIKVLEMPEFGESQGRIVDYIMADAAEKLRTSVRTGGLASADSRAILDSLKPYRQALNRPEFAEQAAKLDEFERAIIQNEGDVKALDEVLSSQKQASSEIAEEIYERRLKEFFDKTGAPLPRGYASMSEMFTDPQIVGDAQTPGRLDQIVKMAEDSDDPTVMEGLKSAYMKYFRNSVFTPTPTATSGRALSPSVGRSVLEEEDNVLAIGRQLFKGDESLFVEALEGLLNPSLEGTVAKKIAGMKTTEGQAPYRKAKEAVNRLVLVAVGPLTRLGARMAVGAGAALDALDPNQSAAKIADAMFADREEFLRMAKDWIASKQPRPEHYRQLFTFLVRAGIYQNEDENEWMQAVREQETEAQIEEAFPQ